MSVKKLLEGAALQEQKIVKATEKQDVPVKKTAPSTPQKNRGGRPTNAEKGLKTRKQYTLTLKEETYQMILDKAKAEDLSFAKYMERAALEYINNHM